MTDKKPSQVFLAIWQALTVADPEMPNDEFADAAEAWRQIVCLEEFHAEAQRQRAMQDALDALGAVSPIAERSDSDTDGQEGTGGDTSSGAAAPPSPQGEGITYDCASAPMPDPAEAAKAAAMSAAGVSSLATRKRRALERLETVRERGISMADVVAAGPGLTLNDVLDALDRKPLPLPKLAALEKALARIEGGDQSAPPSRKRGRKVTADDG